MRRALQDVEAALPQAEPKPEKPDTRALEDVLHHALDRFDEENRQAAAGSRPAARRAAPVAPVAVSAPLDTDRPPARRRRLSVAGAVVVAAALGAVVAAWYAAQSRPEHAIVASTARQPSGLPVTMTDRAAIGQTVAVLHDLHTVSRVDVPYRVYFNRVSFAKADVQRYTQGLEDAEVRDGLRSALALHVLAAEAWRAKTLNERDKWEAVGNDPAIDLCPPAQRLLSVSDEAPNVTRAQWRGIAVAAAIPLLWDCAADRVADIEQSLRGR
jgi:hypothetical protein